MSPKKAQNAKEQQKAPHNLRDQRISQQLGLRRWICSQHGEIAVSAKSTIQDSRSTGYRRLAKK
jgi:hypothetical protein